MPSPSAPFHTANHEGIECRDRIGFRPEPHSACGEARVVMVQVLLAIEPSLDVIADGHDANRMPLTKRWRLDARRRQLTPPTVVVVEPEVVLQRIGPDNVVLAVVETKDDTARSILL